MGIKITGSCGGFQFLVKFHGKVFLLELHRKRLFFRNIKKKFYPKKVSDGCWLLLFAKYFVNRTLNEIIKVSID